MGETPGVLKSGIFGQLGAGGQILKSRGDGWDLRDSEGWYRYSDWRPLLVKDLVILDEKGFVGFSGDLNDARYTFASTSDGRRFLTEDN